MLTHLWKSMLDWRLFGEVSGSCQWLNVLLPRCTWDLRWLAKFSSPSQRAEDSACSRQGSLCRVACQECTYAAWFWVKSESSQQSPCKLSNSIHFILKSEITNTIKKRKANVSHQDHLGPQESEPSYHPLDMFSTDVVSESPSQRPASRDTWHLHPRPGFATQMKWEYDIW